MSKTAYVMGAGGDWKRVRYVQTHLRARGYVIENDWTIYQDTDEKRRIEHEGELGLAVKASAAITNMMAAKNSDLCVMVCGPCVSQAIGAWIETGAAMSHGRQVHVINPPRDSVFWEFGNVRVFQGTLDWLVYLDA